MYVYIYIYAVCETHLTFHPGCGGDRTCTLVVTISLLAGKGLRQGGTSLQYDFWIPQNMAKMAIMIFF